MKFTLSWLKDHLDTSASVEELADKLSSIGLEVESIDKGGEKLSPAFTIARVLEAKQHPNADRLQVCKVDTGKGIVEVVCGAPNARAGMIGVFAPIGTLHPRQPTSRWRRAPCAASSRPACWCRRRSWSSPTTTRASSSSTPSSATGWGSPTRRCSGSAIPSST